MVAGGLAALALGGCGVTPLRDTATIRSDLPRPAPSAGGYQAPTMTLQRLADEAAALHPVAQSSLGHRFLDATRSLPAMGNRTIYLNEITRTYFSARDRGALPAATQAKLSEVVIDEERYYYTKYGSPLAYLRVLDLAATNGIGDVGGMRILDFGYGSVGQLRLLASLGAYVTGIDPDTYLAAIYSQPRDQGPVPPASGARRGHPGAVTLAHGYWPKDPKMVDRVGTGYDLIVSKNTLKKGYVKPSRKIDKRYQTELGVSDDVFLKSVFNALNPGGRLIIYNLYPRPAGPKERYRPEADAGSPWPSEQFVRSGFHVVAHDAEDHAMARSMGRALKWDRDAAGEPTDLESNLFATYTIVERPVR